MRLLFNRNQRELAAIVLSRHSFFYLYYTPLKMICQQFFLRKIYRAGVPRGTFRSSKETKKQFCFIQNRRNFRNLLTSAIFCARICPKGNNASAHGTVASSTVCITRPEPTFGDLLRGIFLSFIIHDSFILCQAFFRSFFGRLKGAFHFPTT